MEASNIKVQDIKKETVNAVQDKFNENMYVNAPKSKKRRIRKMRLKAMIKAKEEAMKAADDASEIEPEREIRELEKKRMGEGEKVKVYEEAKKAADDANETKSDKEIRDIEK